MSSEGFRHLRVRPEQRNELAEPLGPVLTGDEARERARSLPELVACGDKVTESAVAWGVRPRLAIVDGRTLRGPEHPIPAEVRDAFPVHRTVANPAGEITRELQRTLEELLRGPPALLKVDGEEDLAVLPLLSLLPVRTTVIYGQPGAGVAFVEVSEAIRAKARAWMDRMEVLG